MMAHRDPGYLQALRFAAALNLAMLVIEGGIGWWIGSAALLADAVDFLEDAALLALALAATGWSVRARAGASLVMTAAMAGVGAVALWQVVLRLTVGGIPAPLSMATTAALALAVNAACAFSLARYKRGDASMHAVWLSARNDVALNGLTILAAALVALTVRAWPDILAGLVIAAVNLRAALKIGRMALGEWRGAPAGA